MISLVAVIGRKRELGKDGGLLFDLPEDMRYFRRLTEGHKVLMGRKTWESLPGKLAGRENIVVSRGEVNDADEVVHDLEEFLEENKDTPEEIFIIGGGKVYRTALPYAECLYLTEVDAEDMGADTWFPEFDQAEFDKEVLGEGKEGDMGYRFVKYTRKGVKE